MADTSTAETFEAFVRSNWARHRWFARAIARDWQDAEDLLQEGLYRVFRAWSHAAVAEHPDAYLRTTLVRLAARRSRRLWNREIPTTIDRDGPLDQPGRGLTEHEDLLAAISTLPPRQRAAIALRYIQDLSVADTAAAMKCAESTVKSLTGQGLAALQRVLAAPSLDKENTL